MSFQQLAGSALTFGRGLLPFGRRVAGTLASGVLIGTMFATAASAGTESPDRHLVKAPSATSQTAKSGDAQKSETPPKAAETKSSTEPAKAVPPTKPTQKPETAVKTQSLAGARKGDWGLCRDAATDIEARHSMPKHMLSAVTLTETGRSGPDGKSLQAWPWTINAGGKGYVFATKQDAVRAVRRLLAQGQRSIDIGCMQVNLKYHPRAFTSLEEAFDPVANLAYGADFLGRLKKRHGSWELAVQHYHSYSEEHRSRYSARFNQVWSLERRRMANADVRPRNKKQALAGLPGVPFSVVRTALPNLEPLGELTPVAALMDLSNNLKNLGEREVIADTRLKSASLNTAVAMN